MEETGTGVVNLKLLGGRVCLDFANTVGWHAGDYPSEHIRSYTDLVLWSRHAGILADDQAQRLVREAAERPGEAAAVLERAIAVREAIYRIFSATADGRSPDAADLTTFNGALSEAMAHVCVVPAADGFAWDWTGHEHALDWMLWPIMRSAAELLTAGELTRVRECSGDTCGWLFVDTSRNRSRRWCDMEDCGNRAKARRHYHRQRAAVRSGGASAAGEPGPEGTVPSRNSAPAGAESS